jgi:hypothetical protein
MSGGVESLTHLNFKGYVLNPYRDYQLSERGIDLAR